MISRSDFNALLAPVEGPAVSLFMTMQGGGNAGRQDSIKMRNLYGQALERLMSMGLRRPDATDILSPVQKLIDDDTFWLAKDRSVAVFVAKGVSHVHHVPIELDERLVVGSEFHLRPLLPLLGADLSFLVVSLTAHRARILTGGRSGLAEASGLQFPRSVEEISAETDYQNTLHSAPPARHGDRRGSAVSMVKTHNFGEDPEEQRKAQLIEYLRRVAAGVEEFVGSRRIPIVLAAQPEVRGHFLAVSGLDLDSVYEMDINPDALGEADLHERSWNLVQDRLEEAEEKELNRFFSLYNDGSTKSSADLKAIVRAARFGHIDLLLVNRDAQHWGRYDEDADTVIVRDAAKEGDEDLLDRAARDTIRHGGTVLLIDGSRLRSNNRPLEAGAIFRFEQPH